MSEDAHTNDTKNVWERFLARVITWLAMDFWQNDEKAKRTHGWMTGLVDDVETEEDMVMAMDQIKGIAKSYSKTNHAMPGGRKGANPVLNKAWDVISTNPQMLITLFTLRNGEVKTMDESVNLGIGRLRNVVKKYDFTKSEEIVGLLTLKTEAETAVEAEAETEVEVNEG